MRHLTRLALSFAPAAVILTPFLTPLMAQDGASLPSANPGRPTVTNPATLAPVGYLQFEQGYLGSFRSPETSTQNGINQVTKLTVHPRLMLEVSSQPFAASRVPGTSGTTHDTGDILAGGQFVLYTPPDPTDDAAEADVHRHAYVRSVIPTVAFAYLNRVRSGTAPDVDLGSQSRTGLFLFSGHSPILDVHYDINIIVSQQNGDVPTAGSATLTHGIRRPQFGQTFSVDRSVFFNSKLQFSLELYHFTQPLVTTTVAQQPSTHAHLVDLLFAPSYQLQPNLIFDAGFTRGLTSTSTRWQAIAGFTYVFPQRLWMSHQPASSK